MGVFIVTEPTGYWTFFCNPQKWRIDDFLLSGEIYDTFSIANHHKDYFEKGQLGVIRVGRDRRSKKQLAGKPRLNPGIYAIVEILDKPQLMKSTKNDYWENIEDSEKIRYRVPIKYVKNLIRTPILLEELNLNNAKYDKYLIEGLQASTMPLNPLAFQAIVSKIGGIDELELEFNQRTYGK